jgi:hypothetical protein
MRQCNVINIANEIGLVASYSIEIITYAVFWIAGQFLARRKYAVDINRRYVGRPESRVRIPVIIIIELDEY